LELSLQRPKFAAKKTANPKPMEIEVKGGLATSKAKNIEAAIKDSNLYLIEGAIERLLEVGGTGGF
jgi:hypothetical protein